VKRRQEERPVLLTRNPSAKTMHKKASKRVNVGPGLGAKASGLEAVVEGSGDEEEEGRRKGKGKKRGGVGDDGFYEDVVDHFMVTDPQVCVHVQMDGWMGGCCGGRPHGCPSGMLHLDACGLPQALCIIFVSVWRTACTRMT
jgi:hypothetical protein